MPLPRRRRCAMPGSLRRRSACPGHSPPARPAAGGGAATPSFELPAGAPAGIPGPARPTRIGRREFVWGRRTYVMGILNVTPDSFSGDGLLVDDRDHVARSVELGRRMAE